MWVADEWWSFDGKRMEIVNHHGVSTYTLFILLHFCISYLNNLFFFSTVDQATVGAEFTFWRQFWTPAPSTGYLLTELDTCSQCRTPVNRTGHLLSVPETCWQNWTPALSTGYLLAELDICWKYRIPTRSARHLMAVENQQIKTSIHKNHKFHVLL